MLASCVFNIKKPQWESRLPENGFALDCIENISSSLSILFSIIKQAACPSLLITLGQASASTEIGMVDLYGLGVEGTAFFIFSNVGLDWEERRSDLVS